MLSLQVNSLMLVKDWYNQFKTTEAPLVSNKAIMMVSRSIFKRYFQIDCPRTYVSLSFLLVLLRTCFHHCWHFPLNKHVITRISLWWWILFRYCDKLDSWFQLLLVAVFVIVLPWFVWRRCLAVYLLFLTLQAFITTMDAIKLNQWAVDEVGEHVFCVVVFHMGVHSSLCRALRC